MKQYAVNLGIALWALVVGIDRLGNAVLFGDPTMTISARMGRAIRAGHCRLCRPICWLLNLVDRNHCASSDAAAAGDGSDQITPV